MHCEFDFGCEIALRASAISVQRVSGVRPRVFDFGAYRGEPLTLSNHNALSSSHSDLDSDPRFRV